MYIQQVASELRKPLPTGNRHSQRHPKDLQSAYLPWQLIRDRLDLVCPDWQVSYSDPVLVSDYITVRCRLTVAGITREATGSDKGYLRIRNGSKIINTPELATIAAFVNAAAQFGIGIPSRAIKHTQHDYATGDRASNQLRMQPQTQASQAKVKSQSAAQPPSQSVQIRDQSYVQKHAQTNAQTNAKIVRLPTGLPEHSSRPESGLGENSLRPTVASLNARRNQKKEMLEVSQMLRQLRKKHQASLRSPHKLLQSNLTQLKTSTQKFLQKVLQ